MLKVLVLSEDKYYADGLKQLITEIAGGLHAGPVVFLDQEEFGDYRQAAMVFCDVPVCGGLQSCSLGFSYHLHIRLSPVCCYTGLYDGQEDVRPCPGQFSALLSRRAPVEQVRDVLRKQIAALNKPRYLLKRRETCHGCRLPFLSSRECEVLSAISRGESLKVIGSSMGISDKTVGTHKARVMQKLGNVNNLMLYRYAAHFTGMALTPVGETSVDGHLLASPRRRAVSRNKWLW